jgi:hypothetical protein
MSRTTEAREVYREAVEGEAAVAGVNGEPCGAPLPVGAAEEKEPPSNSRRGLLLSMAKAAERESVARGYAGLDRAIYIYTVR